MGRIHVDAEECISCGDCTLACSSILVSEGGKIQVVDEEYCTHCGHCLALCPVEAISIEGLDPREFPDLPQNRIISPENLTLFLRSRRSCRVFSDKEVSKEDLEKLVDTARYAPTGHNAQNFQFIVIQNRQLIRTLSERASIFYGNLYKRLSAPGTSLSPWLQSHMRGMKMIWDFYQAGKDRIFRNAPALVIIHAPVENVSSGQNCHLAMAHLMLQAQAMGMGTCIIGYFITASDRDPSIVKELEVPKENKIFTCCTVGYPALKFMRLVQRKPAAVRWL